MGTVLQQEAYLLFYIRDKDHKPTNIPFPPGSSTHFKADPNFLGSSNKHFSSGAGLDKTGTPLVRLKPTGVVQPSPQKDTASTIPKPPLPSKGQSSSPPVPASGGLVTPKSKSVSPNSSGGSGNGMASPMMRDFSIPLRKISSTATPSSRYIANKTEAARTTNALPHPPADPAPRQQATPTAATSLRFTPRQISSPPSKMKKQQKIVIVTSATGIEKSAATEDKEVTSDAVHKTGIQMAPSIASQSTNDKVISEDGNSTVVDSESKPVFKAIQSEEPTAQGHFIGPLLPTSPSSSLPQSPLRVTPFSLKPSTTSPASSKAVAMVPPQPQAREKPVARVLPNPHVQEDDETTPRKMASSKEGSSLPSTPGPHLNAVTPWKVRDSTSGEAFGPALPEGLEYNSSAHGWNVSTIASGGEEGQKEKGEEHVTPHGKAKKHKKKKKHRKREEDESNESEGERGGGKREKNKRENNAKKMKSSRDVSYSPERGRRRYSHSPDKGYHHHSTHHSPERTLHYDRHRKYRRHSYRERDRETSDHFMHRRHKHKGNRYSYCDRSRSRSRSPLNPDSEDRYYYHHRERQRTSPSRHVHQHHHHAPFLDMGEGGGGHWKSHHHSSPYHRVKHSSDSSERRVNIKSDEARRRERKRSHHHDTMSEDENDHKKYKKSVQSGKKDE